MVVGDGPRSSNRATTRHARRYNRVETSTGTQLREIRAGSSFLAQDDIRAHFGLGRESVVKRLEVRWPSGRIDRINDVQADRILTVREGQGLVP